MSPAAILLVTVATLVPATLGQDGLKCTNEGEAWKYQCNTCSCRSGVTVCTKAVCSASSLQQITTGPCLAGTKWKDGCGNTCLCDPSGKTRCTLGSCPPRVSPNLSVTFIRAPGDPCTEGDTWKMDCNSCSCVGGKAACTMMECIEPTNQPLPPCETGEKWEDECGNLCTCTKDGQSTCTMLPCLAGKRAGAKLRPISQSGDECSNEGERWQQDCNECDCNGGVVTCTRRLCPQRQMPEEYGTCQPGTKWVDECENECHCLSNGIPSCTLKGCPYGKQEGVVSHYLLDDGATCTSEDESWEQGCNTCTCTSGVVTCTKRACPAAFAARSGGLSLGEEEGGVEQWVDCDDDPTWQDECGNICSCWLGGPICTRMGCPKGRVAGKFVKFIYFEGDKCRNEGESWKDDCNTCSCTDGVVVCTKKFCHKARLAARFISPFIALTCTPGQRWVDECENYCFCPDSGISACTLAACPPGKRPMVPVRYIRADGDNCTEEGSTWRQSCQTCRCTGGTVTCTDEPCGVQRPLLRATLQSVQDAGPGADGLCEKDQEWTDECGNHCQCSGQAHAMCTTRNCPPGKQAGKPQPRRPKSGEPCDGGSEETWLSDCNTCHCDNGLTACTKLACVNQPTDQPHNPPVQQCRPGSTWLDECDNMCRCDGHGVPYCTLKACPYGKQYGVPQKYVLDVNDTCTEEGKSWKQACNTCTCTDGRVTCTEQLCVAAVEARFGFSVARERCRVGSKWVDECGNTCRCLAGNMRVCTLQACAPGKTAGVRVRSLPSEGDSCESGKSWTVECNRCKCTGGKVKCTKRICSPILFPGATNSDGEEDKCTEGEEFIDECANRCKCLGGELRCTRRDCPPGRRAGVPVRYVLADGSTCANDGEEWKDDCNTCTCDGGAVSCTKRACVGFERGGGKKKPGNCPYIPPGTLGFCINGCNGDDMCEGEEKCCSNGCGAECMKPASCVEGLAWKEECNTCTCLNGEPACTKKFCVEEKPQSDEPVVQEPIGKDACLDGSVWREACNVCTCTKGHPACTKRLCPTNPTAVDENTPADECRDGSVWNSGCNRCRCIGGRATCTLKACQEEENIINETEDICSLPPIIAGKTPCAGYIPRWTFDPETGTCKRYIFGGCHGTDNLFLTEELCQKRCKPSDSGTRAAACRLPLNEGNCFGLLTRYYFDSSANKCQKFRYSGCDGNANNFKTLIECVSTCGGTYTSQDAAECDRSSCPWHQYKHYTDRGCEPVYEEGGCCPSRFECPEMRSAEPGADSNHCVYHGQQYPLGAEVTEVSQVDPCKQGCVCTASAGRGLRIQCGEVDCPPLWNQLAPGCVPLYEPHKCCPVDVKCPARERRYADPPPAVGEESTCTVDGVQYVQGQLMPTRGDPCSSCVCTAEYTGRPDGPGCRRTDCLDFRPSGDGCVPVYKHDVCCPVDWKCPEQPKMRNTIVLFDGITISQPINGARQPVCMLPKKVGPCQDWKERYYFDLDRAECVSFTYGGCQANGNNFESLTECSATCSTAAGNGLPGSTNLHNGKIVPLAAVRGGACLLPTVAGDCSEPELRFTYRPADGGCVSFVYSGCGGNDNNFASMDLCQNTCTPRDKQAFCILPKESGPCKAAKPRYFYNTETDMCEKFLYGGCRGNENNFLTEEECFNKCGTGTSENKLQLQKLAARCLAPVDPGPCRSHQPRYHYSPEAARCLLFKYGGCLGNENNFATKEECVHSCASVALAQAGSRPEDMCTFGNHSVPRGARLDDGDKCTVCDCQVPPKLTCRKLYCPQIPSGQEQLCRYRQLEPDSCCPELVCDPAAVVPPNPSPQCRRELCHLPAPRPGCSVAHRPGECCPQVECTTPPGPQEVSPRLLGPNICQLPMVRGKCRAAKPRYFFNATSHQCELFYYGGCDGNENNFRSKAECHAACADNTNAPGECPEVECPGTCATSRDRYGCLSCDCGSLSGRTEPACARRFCPVGCPSHYEDGCIVCECDCPQLQCPADCGTRLEDGCPVCHCSGRLIPTLPPLRRCAELRCPRHCALVTGVDGCSACDCPGGPGPSPPAPPPPCPQQVCPAHCGMALVEGCYRCLCDQPFFQQHSPPRLARHN